MAIYRPRGGLTEQEAVLLDQDKSFVGKAKIEQETELAKLRFGEKQLLQRASESNIEKTRESRMGRAQKIEEIRFGISLFDRFKPILIGGLILLFLIGPGLSAVMQIIGAMNLWYWIGFIVVGILIWRNM
jgi:hypothetical protein